MRRASPEALAALPPPAAFRTPRGREFSVAPRVVAGAPPSSSWWAETFAIAGPDGREAGSISRSTIYPVVGRFGWTGSLSALRMSAPGFAWASPRGLGYDVAAFATAAECVEAWALSADQILDWKPASGA